MKDRSSPTRPLTIIVAAALLFAVAYMVYMRIDEGRASVIGQAETYMLTHLRKVEVAGVIAVAASFTVWSACKFASWWTLRGTRDETRVGVTLKHQKLAEAVVFAIWAGYWWRSLYRIATGTERNIWLYYGVILFVVGGTIIAVGLCIRFVAALLHEDGAGRTADQDARDVRQDAREDRLDLREDGARD